MGFQSWESPNFENFGIPNFGNPETKWHLTVGPMAMHKKYYKGEGDSFPQIRAMVNLVSSCLLVACSCTKNAPIMH
jgi:hypothetical protein